jgi:hypothetical protein
MKFNFLFKRPITKEIELSINEGNAAENKFKNNNKKLNELS